MYKTFEKALEVAKELSMKVESVRGKLIDGKTEVVVFGKSNGTKVRLKVEGQNED